MVIKNHTKINNVIFFLVVLFLLQVTYTLIAQAGSSIFHTDPPAVVTFSNDGLTILRKELTGHGEYGVADRRSDILYSTESDQWNFDLSTVPLPGPIKSAEVVISLVLDDHYGRSESDYVGKIVVNNTQVFSGGFFTILGVPHGAPYGSIFENWKQASFQITNLTPSIYTVTIDNNTSGPVGGDWIAIDYIELYLYT